MMNVVHRDSSCGRSAAATTGTMRWIATWLSATLLALQLVASSNHGAVAAHRVVAIGDLHGDIENAREAFRLAQVTNDTGHWVSGTDTVIQMGDVVDRGPHGHTIMDWLEGLKPQAEAAGGELVTLLGNHELMNYQGDSKFAPPQIVELFGGLGGWKALFATPTARYGGLISNRPAIVHRNGTVFVHAGIVQEVAAMGTIETINSKVHHSLARRDFSDSLLAVEGPMWTRRLIYGAQKGNCEPTLAALQELNRVERNANPDAPRIFRRMVVGHTIQPNGAMRVFCNGTLFAVDIAISQYMQNGGHLGHLELREGTTAGSKGVEVPWFWYPAKPAAQHALSRPVMPPFLVAALEAKEHDRQALKEKLARFSNHHASSPEGGPHDDVGGPTSGDSSSSSGEDSATSHSPGSSSYFSRPQLSRWVSHHRHNERDQAIFLALVAVAVILWRIVYNWRSYARRGAHKKNDGLAV